MTPPSRNETATTIPRRMKRLFSVWNLDNIKVVKRVIVSVVGATVLLIGIALLVLPGPAFVVIPAASAAGIARENTQRYSTIGETPHSSGPQIGRLRPMANSERLRRNWVAFNFVA